MIERAPDISAPERYRRRMVLGCLFWLKDESVCRQYAKLGAVLGKITPPKMPKGINRGSVYNEKVVTRDGHDLATWESVFCLCVCRTLVNEGLQHFRTT